MGHRYVIPTERDGDYSFRMMEVVMVEKMGGGKETSTSRVMLVDNHWDTLRYVQEHMNDFVSNMIKVNKMTRDTSRKIDESAQLFEKNLQPLFSIISETSKTHILDKLSNSLKKALILMAMDRYKSDTESICKALGITQDKLEREMNLCGLKIHRQAA
ncbi:hypothetical protein [Geobacter sp. DSM 9736]|uniref:hypothetical protein n=1 Tax=Geobacter sp. DSM 9736 TaxID=1277350 RepID=UPI000B50FF35|nr:hypothetical protein [Geobacter sp. DSM 9736]SNB45310.1 hypothetical protein SAMN06269301_0717 [Geobacter sp. DSM 9736]